MMSLSKPVDQLAHELSCPICLQLYSDPVVLPCGHNYCRSCIQKTADATDQTDKTPPRCPECRVEFLGVESFQRNFKLSSIIEGFRATVSMLDKRAEMEVFCDHCIDGQILEKNTCMKCDMSLCSRHLQKHQEEGSFKTANVGQPLKKLGVKDCAVHHRPLEYFCSNEMTLLCATCFEEGDHHNHDVLTFSAAEKEMRRALKCRTKVVSSRLQMTESCLQETTEDQGASEAVGDKMVSKSVSLMDRMAALVDRYRERLSLLFEEERGQRRKSWQLGLSALAEQKHRLLEAQQGASEVLKETDTCLFIHRFLLIEQTLRETVNSASSKLPSKVPLNTKRLQAGLKTQDFRSEMTYLLDCLHTLLKPFDVTFNVCTAHHSLIVSKDLQTVKYNPTKRPCVEHPERFTSAPQVLCSQGFSSGEHVWLVEVGASTMWSLGLCYKSIRRRGDHSRLGHNSVSWRLQWKNRKLTVCQSSSNVALGGISSPLDQIEIALDYEGGTLMFHTTKGIREHIYTFRAVFREPVYPAFSIHSNTSESWITVQSGL